MESVTIDLTSWRSRLKEARLLNPTGRVTRVIGLTVEAQGINAPIGEVCEIKVPGEPNPVQSEVVGFRDGSTLLMPLGELRGIYQGCSVAPTGKTLSVRVGEQLLGRIINGLGVPMDGLGPLKGNLVNYPVDNSSPNPLMRKRINEVLSTGIKAIDSLMTCGKGQRVGIFAGSGVGKSTLMGMVSRYSNADVNVIALIGERGREVLDFIETNLGPEGLGRSVVIVATSEQPALVRLKGALAACAIAEGFRDQGKDVLLMMDSVTRFAMAQREVGLAIGEPPATKGYTPSVFALLPKLLERPGKFQNGSITAFFTVLVDGDDFNEPISDAVRAILDGHIVLSRSLGAANHFPAVDVLNSVSRLMPDITSKEHQALAGKLRDLLAAYRQAEDLINIGAYVAGSNPRVDEAIGSYQDIVAFLRQDLYEHCDFDISLEMLREITHQGVSAHS
ncbi:MAG: flagellar protein export ATPase FliI [Eubacteriales bacterium]